jgi:hypothetical protein
VYEYDHKAKMKRLTILSTPDSNNIQAMILDRGKNYFFAGAFDSGRIYIYEMTKPGHEKFIKQVATLSNKPGIICMHWIP